MLLLDAASLFCEEMSDEETFFFLFWPQMGLCIRLQEHVAQ